MKKKNPSSVRGEEGATDMQEHVYFRWHLGRRGRRDGVPLFSPPSRRMNGGKGDRAVATFSSYAMRQGRKRKKRE